MLKRREAQRCASRIGCVHPIRYRMEQGILLRAAHVHPQRV
jgi:hypothetical protein